MIKIDDETLYALPFVTAIALVASSPQEDWPILGSTVAGAARGDLEHWARLAEQFARRPRSWFDPWPQDGVEWKQLMDSSWSRESILVYLKCETILFRATSQSETGLDQFVSAFDQFTHLRRQANLPPG